MVVCEDHCYGILAVLEKGKVGEVHVADKHGHDQRYAIDFAKAMRELGWTLTTMFKEGIVLNIDWYMSEE